MHNFPRTVVRFAEGRTKHYYSAASFSGGISSCGSATACNGMGFATTGFGRRLYSAQGGKTFDEVRRRYQAENDFRGTVDRYLQEFERLLAEIDNDDRDGSMTRSYLTSDSGKVYTLLAHAAGRLG